MKPEPGHDLTLLYQYFFNKQVRADNYVVQLENNIRFRDADCLDHLEMIMAHVRKDTIDEVAHEVRLLLPMVKRV